MEDGVVAGGIWQLHQNLIQQHRLHGQKLSVTGCYDNAKESVVFVCVHYRFVHLQLRVVLVTEQLVGPRRGELLCSVSQKQEVVEEESPQLLVAFYLVNLKRNQRQKSTKLFKAGQLGHC